MTRGLRQGCPISCLNFILVTDILGLSIRQSENVEGIKVGNNEHKIIQYADDATICVRNCDSVTQAVKSIETFSEYAGPKLNYRKTKGIWIGSLKDLGLRKFSNIRGQEIQLNAWVFT